MQLTDDMKLLRDYAARGSEPAFETLVYRHVNLVYSAAFRRVRDPVLAGEVTQTVFIILAKKAHSLSPATVLSGWLYRTAQLAAGHALRAACRRRKHEEEAATMLHQEPEPSDSAWEQIAPFLEEAMARLGEADRNVVVLRYFENKDFKAIGAALGFSEDAAQKRTARAIEKLRVLLARRAVLLTAVAVTAALSAHAVEAAPAGMAASVSSASLTGTAATSPTATLLKGTLRLMAWTKLKTAAVVGLAALFVAGTTVTMTQAMRPPDYSWEIAPPTLFAFTNARPQLTILPTKFGSNVIWRTIVSPDGKCMGIKMTPEEIIQSAYRAGRGMNGIRTIVATSLPQEEYDFICNLPHDASNALQNAITKKFGATASFQMIETNVLVLSLRTPNAPGLVPSKKNGRQSYLPGHWFMPGQTIRALADRIDLYFGLPVVDETGVTGKYQMDLTWEPPSHGKPPSLEPFNQSLIDQLGLELTPKIQPVKMLVIEKAR